MLRAEVEGGLRAKLRNKAEGEKRGGSSGMRSGGRRGEILEEVSLICGKRRGLRMAANRHAKKRRFI